MPPASVVNVEAVLGLLEYTVAGVDVLAEWDQDLDTLDDCTGRIHSLYCELDKARTALRNRRHAKAR